MNILLVIAACSFGVIAYMLRSQADLVRERKEEHNETVGMKTVLAPIARVARRPLKTAHSYARPYVVRAFHDGSVVVHKWLIWIGQRLFVFAAKIQGRRFSFEESKTSQVRAGR